MVFFFFILTSWVLRKTETLQGKVRNITTPWPSGPPTPSATCR
jgi:hypothetical protein